MVPLGKVGQSFGDARQNLHRMLGNLVGEAVDAFVQLGRDRLNR